MKCLSVLQFQRIARGGAIAAVVAGACFQAQAADEAQLKLGKDLFSKGSVPACAVCHTLRDAGAEGAIGPSLDEVKPVASRVATALRNGIGQMPSYAGRLDDKQIAALSAYVAKVTGAAK
ncbi:c-type cytochrome [Pseudorhodoferax soli]|uniref:Mono/diheme cytochrome c family protein n=1 Tax=Pseudorhodoferax soli TaxID=545864 RepID=A0A368X5X8_9BURK|nr:cytochrome c [Pseudorhodoferax soli]RCW63225.1 mono/diheme cytochrome c family protein [Pseudorhodoferax soli]